MSRGIHIQHVSIVNNRQKGCFHHYNILLLISYFRDCLLYILLYFSNKIKDYNAELRHVIKHLHIFPSHEYEIKLCSDT